MVASFAMLPRSMFAVPAVFCNTKLYLPRLIWFYYDIIGTNLGPDVSCGCLSSCTKGSVCLPRWGRLDLWPSTKWEDAHDGISRKGEWPGHTKFCSKRRWQTNGNNATEGLQKSSHVRWDSIYVFKDLGTGWTIGVVLVRVYWRCCFTLFLRIENIEEIIILIVEVTTKFARKYIYTLLTISTRAVSIWNRFHHQLKHLCFFSSVEPSSVISRPELSSTSRHAGRNFHEVFQLRQGGYSDLPSSKISDMMKSTSLDVSTVY